MLDWETAPDGVVHIGLLYDHERASPNRAAGHWHFQLHAPAGSELALSLEHFDNIWNGRFGSPLSERTNCYASSDGSNWTSFPVRKTEDNRLEFTVRMERDTLTLARLEPYRLSDLDRFLAEIESHSSVEIASIGRTVEGRPLEIVRVGDPGAPINVLIRARSHPWEPGGNWVAEGLIRSLLEESDENRRYLDRYCLYVLPMADKDGVVRGRTRFNVLGMDLNRGWERPASPDLAPENHALETWLDAMTGRGTRFQLAMDLHNDNSGRLHLSQSEARQEAHAENMKRLESLLYKYTWFTEGRKEPQPGSPWTFGEGLLARYGIDACILELNCDWIAGLQKPPFGTDWMRFGRQLREVFFQYLGG
jgi:hypothetical protein